MLSRLLPPLSLVTCLALAGSTEDSGEEAPVDFGRDIRPLLSDNCFFCHGPDEAKREAKLRLDLAGEALRDLGGYAAIVPGDAHASELFLRVSDSDDPMPPADSGRSLTPEEIELLGRWIDEGARWEEHWAYRPPERPAPPRLAGDDWSRGAVDRFLLRGMQAAGLEPAPEASRETLVRRLALDLTGLPPSLALVDAFLDDTAPGAYERVVDVLLASPRYGEHMARAWLDAARYGDTHGYHLDNERTIWPYRDWVIRAFNSNQPFDAFTIEQLAGDLLPEPTREQRVATGFQRCNPTSAEGGMIAAEYLAKYAADRVVTLSAVWLGSTLLCAECHDHKFDPVTQREFYELSAFFNSVAEQASDGNGTAPPPILRVPSAEEARDLDRLAQRIAELDAGLAAPDPELDATQAAWETEERARIAERWSPLELLALDARAGTELRVLADGSVLAEGPEPASEVYEVLAATEDSSLTALRLEALRHESLASGSIGRASHGNIVLSDVELAVAPRAAPGRFVDVPLALATADYSQTNYEIEKAVDDDPASGWAVDGKPEDRAAWFLAAEPFGAPGGSILRLRLAFESPHQRHAIGRFRLDVTSDSTLRPVPLATDEESAPPSYALGDSAPVAVARALTAAEPTDEDAARVRDHFRRATSPAWAARADENARLRSERSTLEATVPTTLVMEELPEPRPAHVLVRGRYDRPGDEVQSATPAFLPPLGVDGRRATRLDLARWLVRPDHPLTARVTVNRIWQELFGTGLVKTTEDFGSQGEWPSHPELLDWLATEFVASGWDVKALLRRLVTSAAYRQDAAASPAKRALDPENRLLARGPRHRLDAERVRDSALAISGLLVEHIGGPSVKPYQPDGLWRAVAYTSSNTARFERDEGDALYRRSLYTFWKRTSPPPTMQLFDAPTRETCTLRRERTNTPLQALALLNDVQFFEAARAFAERVLREAAGDETRLVHAFRLATARRPDAEELGVLQGLLDAERMTYATAPDRAAELVAVGASSPTAEVPAPELAAWTHVCNLLLNLDEVVVR